MGKKSMVVVGASRGIGAEVANYFSSNNYDVVGVSRSRSKHCEWIEADIATPEGIQQLLTQLGERPVDALFYSSGTWEEYGFLDSFDFLKTSDEETRRIMSVNVIAPIEITKGLVSNLSRSDNPRAIYLGALSGMEKWASNQVAYTASKFGLRGALAGLRQALKETGIGLSVINPGNVATEEVLQDIEAGRFQAQTPIPIADILSCTEWLLSLSHAVDVDEVNLIQKGR